MAGRERSLAYRVATVLLRPPLMVWTRRDWQGGEHLPSEGGFVACVNHISYLDPFTFAHFLHDHGCPPRFLAKESVFRVPVGGAIVRGAGQIPVHRETADAGRAYDAAVRAVEQGECVVVYPEATLTRDPGRWPMVGKTGAARVALSTGCPVIPVAQWGIQEVLPPYAGRVRPLPRPRVQVWAGPAVDLDRFRGRPVDALALRAATDAIMREITRLLEGIRGEPAPPERWNPAGHGQPRIGDPRRERG